MDKLEKLMRQEKEIQRDNAAYDERMSQRKDMNDSHWNAMVKLDESAKNVTKKIKEEVNDRLERRRKYY